MQPGYEEIMRVSFNKYENFKKNFFFKFFSVNVNSALFGISLWQQLFNCRKNICFEAIQDGGRSNWLLHAWIEVCHDIFGDWQVYKSSGLNHEEDDFKKNWQVFKKT